MLIFARMSRILMTQEFIIGCNTLIFNLLEHAMRRKTFLLLCQSSSSRGLVLHAVFHITSVPFDKIDDPSKKNGGTLINR